MKTKTNVWRRVWSWYVDWCERINDGRFAPETPVRAQNAGTYEDDAEERAKRQRIAKAKRALKIAKLRYRNRQLEFAKAGEKLCLLDRVTSDDALAEVAFHALFGGMEKMGKWETLIAAHAIRALPPAVVENQRFILRTVEASAAQEMGMAERALIEARAAYENAVHEGEVHLGGGACNTPPMS